MAHAHQPHNEFNLPRNVLGSCPTISDDMHTMLRLGREPSGDDLDRINNQVWTAAAAIREAKERRLAGTRQPVETDD